MSAYYAIVCKVHTRKHPNADRLKIGTCVGHQVVVGADTQDGELGVFFPTEGQLSELFCQANRLIAEHDATGKNTGGGYFDQTRRVKAQSFRGSRSDGFWVPISFFTCLGNVVEIKDSNGDIIPITQCAEGFNFTHVLVNSNPVEICRKYVTALTIGVRNAIDRSGNSVLTSFPEHGDTQHLRYYATAIPDGALITITHKLHGTSGRYGRVLVTHELELPWWKRAINKLVLLFPQYEEKWEYVIGTKTAVVYDGFTGSYGSADFRREAVKNLTLKRGEIIYFELVGYVNDTRLIMQPQPIADKALKKVYGEKMEYTYGCAPGECQLYVYRITQQDVEGNHIELPWAQVKRRCSELGLLHVPEWGSWIYDSTAHDLIHMADVCANGASGQDAISDAIDPSHIMEGVVVRADSMQGTDYYKQKSWWFGVLEGDIKNNREFVDAEEVS